jgi:hypothetical protein
MVALPSPQQRRGFQSGFGDAAQSGAGFQNPLANILQGLQTQAPLGQPQPGPGNFSTLQNLFSILSGSQGVGTGQTQRRRRRIGNLF